MAEVYSLREHEGMVSVPSDSYKELLFAGLELWGDDGDPVARRYLFYLAHSMKVLIDMAADVVTRDDGSGTPSTDHLYQLLHALRFRAEQLNQIAEWSRWNWELAPDAIRVNRDTQGTGTE